MVWRAVTRCRTLRWRYRFAAAVRAKMLSFLQHLNMLDLAVFRKLANNRTELGIWLCSSVWHSVCLQSGAAG